MLMAKKKIREAPENRKPATMVRIRGPLYALAKELAQKRLTDATDEVNRGVRELLEREGLWPPKDRP